MNEKLKTLIMQGSKQAGSYEPAKALSSVQEEMTPDEYDLAQNFLYFVSQNNLTFGHGNFDQVWDAYQASEDHSGLDQNSGLRAADDPNPTITLRPAKVKKHMVFNPILETKDDEIEFLNAIQRAIPGDRYIHDLFTDQFVMEISSRIKNDFGCDLLSELASQGERIECLGQDISIMKDEHKKELKKLQDEIDMKREGANALLDENRTLTDLLEKERAWKADIVEKLQDRDMEIIRLKAQIYDLEHS